MYLYVWNIHASLDSLLVACHAAVLFNQACATNKHTAARWERRTHVHSEHPTRKNEDKTETTDKTHT